MSAPGSDPYETGLDKNQANFVALSPIGFLLRSAAVYPERTAVIEPAPAEAGGERRYTWRQSLERCRRSRRRPAAVRQSAAACVHDTGQDLGASCLDPCEHQIVHLSIGAPRDDYSMVDAGE